MLKKIMILGFLFLSACATHKVGPQAKDSAYLFPYGTYQHQVQVSIPSHGEFSFQGVFDFHPETIKLVGLSPFGTTMFRLQEDQQTHQLKVDIYQDSFKKYEDRIRQMYGQMKKALTLPAGQKHFEDQGTIVDVLSMDTHNIPNSMQVKSSQFTVQIKVTSYETQ